MNEEQNQGQIPDQNFNNQTINSIPGNNQNGLSLSNKSGLIERIRGILINPKEEWVKINNEQTTIKKILLGYVAILAAIGPISIFINKSFVGMESFIGRITLPINYTLTEAVIHYVLSIIAIFLIAIIVNAFAKTFNSVSNKTQAMKLVAYSFTPIWLVSIVSLVSLGLSGILGVLALIYTVYLMYIGIPVLLKTPSDKTVAYLLTSGAVSVITYIIISFLVEILIGSIFISQSGHYGMLGNLNF